MAYDVIVVGAGPAGSLAAAILARQGARVQLFDRARFPRAKLCGDTLNPGAMRVLASHMATDTIDARAVSLDGMLLTGEQVEVRGTYPRGLRARALPRGDLDPMLLRHALACGVQFDDNVLVSGAVTNAPARPVDGVRIRTAGGREQTCAARVIIAADGRQSRLARSVGILRHPRWPRRWAIGGYFEGVTALTPYGEMHVRRGHYIGVAPLPGGLANASLVMTDPGGSDGWRNPAALLTNTIRADARLSERFAGARLVAAPHVLGPMAVDSRGAGVPGMLLAGDAAGFIDPITGDGLHFALAGACLAAAVAGEMLAGRLDAERAVASLASRRRRAFAAKWRFNRAIRALVDRPATIALAAATARRLPRVFERMIQYAGDC